MHLLDRTIPLALAFALFACGGSNPPPNDANSASDAENAPGGGRAGVGPSGATEEEHKAFLTECMEQTPEMKDFCSCSWDTVVENTTAEDRTDLENPNTKKALASLPTQCGSKMPKSVIIANGVRDCAKTPDMEPFCKCSLNFFDSKGMLTATEEEAAKYQGEMKTACSAELQVIAKAAFMRGCGESQTEAVCKCTFASLEKKYGKDKLQGFLETGGDEVKKAARSASAACGAK